ncbi:OmpA family protein [Vibrio mediterranei]|uniref:OmpA family protein n=1 Tax=Vibrio mediterranei TaxID=689 RepID=UPI0040680DD4
MRKGLLMAALLVPLTATAEPLTDISWKIEQEIYQCALTADLPYKNLELNILARPEEPLTMAVYSKGFELFSQDAKLSINTPYWHEKGSTAISSVNVDKRTSNSLYSQDDIEQALEKLKEGFWVGLIDGSFEVSFPSLEMEKFAGTFNECKDAMPLIKFETGKDYDFKFKTGVHDAVIPNPQVNMFDAIASLVLKDKDIVKVLVDGHSDYLGDDVNNLELSKKRASTVAMLLVERGVPVGKIDIRWHGERYPKMSNSTFEGRASNRRVNVRLIKGTQ